MLRHVATRILLAAAFCAYAGSACLAQSVAEDLPEAPLPLDAPPKLWPADGAPAETSQGSIIVTPGAGQKAARQRAACQKSCPSCGQDALWSDYCSERCGSKSCGGKCRHCDSRRVPCGGKCPTCAGTCGAGQTTCAKSDACSVQREKCQACAAPCDTCGGGCDKCGGGCKKCGPDIFGCLARLCHAPAEHKQARCAGCYDTCLDRTYHGEAMGCEEGAAHDPNRPVAASGRLFTQYYAQPRCGGAAAQMYISPYPVPPAVGHTYITYQAFEPHQFMYRHKRHYVRRHEWSGGETSTRIYWW